MNVSHIKGNRQKKSVFETLITLVPEVDTFKCVVPRVLTNASGTAYKVLMRVSSNLRTETSIKKGSVFDSILEDGF